MNLDIKFVRSQFPAFSQTSLDGWAFFENAGGSYPCRQVIERLNDFYTKIKVQPYYPYPASQEGGKLMDEAYDRMAGYLNVDPSEVHFGPSTTQNVYVLAHALRPMWADGDQIIVSCQDHEANAGAWRRLGETGLEVIEWHVDKDSGLLSLSDLESLLTERTRMVAFPHCSNVIGQINPVKEITRLAHEHGAISVVDAVGWAPHGFPDLKDLDTDIYMFSLYKTFGPHLGLMHVKKELIAKMKNQSHFFKEGVTRNMITPAGPDHAQIASVNGILDYFDAVYDHHFDKVADPAERSRAINALFRDYEMELLTELLDFLRTREDVRILGTEYPEDRAPIVSIIPLNRDIKRVYADLIQHKLMLGIGDFYAARPLIDMDIPRDPGVIRMSFIHYTSKEDIEQLIEGLEKALTG